MAVNQLTGTNIERMVEDNPILIIDFWASWCGPCRAFKPIFEAASERHDGVTFASCNTEEEVELAQAMRITSIPTVMVFRDGIPLFSQPGMLPAPMLDQLLDQVKTLDMDDLRRQVAESKKEKNLVA